MQNKIVIFDILTPLNHDILKLFTLVFVDRRKKITELITPTPPMSRVILF